ncbi:hypothetical protein FO519_003110 [Halicephalobus sp. NKZ332]|nr:hypothetical protein FO519_003110 [Halicephalobus sp. NKZ332]
MNPLRLSHNVFQRRLISSTLRSALNSVTSEQGLHRFHERVREDNEKKDFKKDYEERRGDPNPIANTHLKENEPRHKGTFGDGEGSKPPYFRKSSKGDSAVLVCMVNLKKSEKPQNEAEEVDQPWFIYTHRSYHLKSHRGEMCFPGGRMEKDETTEQAALREGLEEINISPDFVTVLSELRPSLTRNLKNSVTPVVTVCDGKALPLLKPQVEEVQSVYLIPMSDLVQSRRYTSFQLRKHKYTLPAFFSNNFKIVTASEDAYYCPDRIVRIWGISGVITDQTISCLLPDEIFPRELHSIVH